MKLVEEEIGKDREEEQIRKVRTIYFLKTVWWISTENMKESCSEMGSDSLNNECAPKLMPGLYWGWHKIVLLGKLLSV